LKQFFVNIAVTSFAWIFLTPEILAQYGADFDVNSESGCAPFTVVVNDLSGAPDTIAVNYDWGDGSPLDSGTVHTYTVPGNYTIIQTVANGDPRQDSVDIEVIEPLEPVFSVFNCKGTFGSILVQDTLYEEYFVDWGNGSSQIVSADMIVSHDFGVNASFLITVKGLKNGSQAPNDSSNIRCGEGTQMLTINNVIPSGSMTSVTVTSIDSLTGGIDLNYVLDPDASYLIEYQIDGTGPYVVADTIDSNINPTDISLNGFNTRDHYYCFRITAFDPCDGELIPSQELCSVWLDVDAENNQNRVQWDTRAINFLDYRLLILETGGANRVVQIDFENIKEYLDTLVTCGFEYQYQLQFRQQGGSQISTSGIITVTAISSSAPDPIANISASVDGDNVLLSWQSASNPQIVEYLVGRSLDGVNFDVIDTSTTTSFVDEGLFTSSTRYYYTIYYTDECGNRSNTSIIGSPVLLLEELDKSLSWSGYIGWADVVDQYIVEKYDQQGNLIATIPVGLDQFFTDPDASSEQIVAYRIQAIPVNPALEPVYSNFVEVIYRSKVEFPNAFTPNGDGMNDIFTFAGRFIMSGSLAIYNRWGELVYQTDAAENGWDGRVNGRYAPLGTYIYYATLVDEMGIEFVKSGEVLLLK
jgi:gliding motility-associated-like protein